METLNINNDELNVINRHGNIVPLDFNKILKRLNDLINMEPKLSIKADKVAQRTISMMVDKITTYELDMLSSKICGSLITENYDYNLLASRIVISNLHKETDDCLLTTLININKIVDENGHLINLINPKLIKFTENYYNDIHSIINYEKDFTFDYFGINTLMKSYLLKDNNKELNNIIERPQHLWMRVSIGIHLCYTNDEAYFNNDYNFNDIKNTYELLSSGYYTHATPTLFNAGTKHASLSSCYLLEVPDDLNGIYKTLSDTAKISKWSGGIGISITKVRSKGTLIKQTNGKSDGIVPMLKVYNDSALYVSQGGGKRKGSTAVYIEPWHADIEGFLDLKKPIGDESARARDLFLALWVPDLFMKRLIQAIENPNKIIYWSLMCPKKCINLINCYGYEFEKNYIEYENNKQYNKQINILNLWNHIMEVQMESGVPYIMYKDAVNRKGNQNNLGVINCSNLCVKGDTLILTKEGYYPIKELSNKNVEIWNGNEFSLSPVRKTNINQKLLKITTDDGCVLECTEYHKFHIVSGARNTKHIIKQANELKEGERLIKCNFPVLKGNNDFDFESPYTHGMYCGDGSNYKLKNSIQPFIDLYHGKQELLQYLDYDRVMPYQEIKDSTRIILNKSINDKFEVPINASLDNKLKWLAGYIDADGTIIKNQNARCVQIACIHKDFIYKVKLLCNTLGLNPKVTKHKNAGEKLMPDNKGLGEMKLYNCKEIYRLLFNTLDTYKLYNELNIPTKRVFNDISVPPQRDARKFVRISSIEEVNGLFDTYCFNESKNNTGIFNGIITGNCAEINIYTDEKNTGVCNLASICLSKFVYTDNDGFTQFNYHKLFDVAKQVTYNINKVIDNNACPVPEGSYSDTRNRPIGLGIQGLADVFMMFKIPFTSDNAKELNKHIFETIYFGALTASNELAQKHGPYETYEGSMVSKGILQHDLCNVVPSSGLWDWDSLRENIKQYGIYNSLLTALMPTASTASIMGNTECFEPITSNMYMRNVLSGNFQIVNKYLIKDLIELGLWNNTIKQKIIANDGSIQNIDEIPQNIKDIYLTVWQYKLKDMIDMDADRGAYICQSMSSNRYVIDCTTQKLTKMHIYAWKQNLKTSSYYIRTKTVNAVKFTVDPKYIKNLKKENKQTNYDVNDTESCMVCSA